MRSETIATQYLVAEFESFFLNKPASIWLKFVGIQEGRDAFDRHPSLDEVTRDLTELYTGRQYATGGWSKYTYHRKRELQEHKD